MSRVENIHVSTYMSRVEKHFSSKFTTPSGRYQRVLSRLLTFHGQMNQKRLGQAMPSDSHGSKKLKPRNALGFTIQYNTNYIISIMRYL